MEVTVYTTNDYTAPLKEFKVLDIKVNPDSDLISAPVETGTESFDNKVIKPNHIIITGIIHVYGENADHDIKKLYQMFLNRKFKFYSVATKEACYENLMLKSCPHTESKDKPDWLVYELDFREALLVQGHSKEVDNSDNSDNRSCGFAMAN